VSKIQESDGDVRPPAADASLREENNSEMAGLAFSACSTVDFRSNLMIAIVSVLSAHLQSVTL
jgi:hypothetical protein